MLPDLLAEYNNSFHRSIKATPVFASKKENEAQIRENINDVQSVKNNNQKKPKYRVGDLVRIYRYKSHFAKGYETNFTKEIFKITKVLSTVHVAYKIEALDGEEILGSMYEQEMVLHRGHS